MSLRQHQVNLDTSTWSGISKNLSDVITLCPMRDEDWNKIFSDVFGLCVAMTEPKAARLYSEIKAFLRERVQYFQCEICRAGDANLLSCYYKAWRVYSKGSYYLENLFFYLDINPLNMVTQYDSNNIGCEADGDKILEIHQLSLLLWRRHMFQEPCQKALVHKLLERIDTYRQHGLPEGELDVIRDVIQSLVDADEANKLELYETMFEKTYLVTSGEYFACMANQLLRECDVYGYMDRVLQVIDFELLRCKSYLNASSHDRVQAELHARLVEDHLNLILAEVPTMVREERRVDLRHLYELLRPLQRAEPLQQLVRRLEEHVRDVGVQRLLKRGTDSPAAFVDTVLHVHNRYSWLVSDLFRNDQLFTSALRRACSAVVNHRGAGDRHCAAPELLVRHCDSLLKKSTKGATKASLQEKMNAIVMLFKFVEDKDALKRYYHKLLAKRLINDRYRMDLEESMVMALKDICANDYTYKLSQMLRDVNVSQDLTQRFLFNPLCGVSLNHSFAIKVMRWGAWPTPITSSIVEFRLPQQLEQSIPIFENFYQGKFLTDSLSVGRKLSWLHHLSYVELRLTYLPRMYLVTLHTFAMAVLVLFEDADSLSVGKIQLTTGLPDDHLARNVQALVDAKLLTCDRTSVCTPDAVLSLNMAFASQRDCFRV